MSPFISSAEPRRHRFGRCLPRILCLLLSLPVQAEVDLNIEGIDGELESNVEAFAELPETIDDPESFKDRLRRSTSSALQALGYYEPTINITTNRDGEDWEVLLEVEPGPPIIVQTFELQLLGEAAVDPAFIALRYELRVQPGARLHHGHYESDKSQIQQLAQERGYFDGRFVTKRLAIHRAKQRADIRLVYNSGPRYELGKVRIPQTPLKESFLRRYITFEPGTPYHLDKILELNEGLRSAPYFKQVRVRPLISEARDRQVPIQLELEPNKRHTVGVGVGVGTDTGARLRLDAEQHWTNRNGHYIRSELEVSQIRQSISGSYNIPLRDPRTHLLQFTGGWQGEDVQETRYDQFSLAVQRQKKRESGWQEVLFYRWERESFRQGDRSGTTDLFIPGGTWSKLRADHRLDPSNGHRQSYELSGTHETLGSDADFLRARMLQKWLWSFLPKHRLLARAELGAIATPRFLDVPPSLRFYAGGDQSVRGYAFQSLGPTDDEGATIGGKFLITGSLEYGWQFASNWRAALFVDSGNAFETTPDDFKTGIGPGIRWISPVGPIRLDLAFALDDEDSPWRIHLHMGPGL